METPRLVVDRTKMKRNIERMAATASGLGVALRPHVKTHKIPWIAREQVEAGATGITVAKVSEAEVMAAGGLRDIFIAYPLVTEEKTRRALALVESGISLTLAVDGMEGAELLSGMAAERGVTLRVRLEVDTGLKRTGVTYEGAVDLAGRIGALRSLDLRGIYTYRGAVMADGTRARDLEAAGNEEGRLMAELASEMRERGSRIEEVSLGSTPTARYAGAVEGVTEIRPGTYVFYDRMQAALGVCSLDDCAASVLATVVSRPARERAIIDGGSKTFATDVQPGRAPYGLEGFGHVVGHPGAVLERLTEEHGMMRVQPDDDLAVGEKVRVIPNHVCSTVNLHDFVYLTDDPDGPDSGFEEVEVAARGRVE
jgi:D-serine deaminase-like pyridoxal phosphate-dependent protein